MFFELNDSKDGVIKSISIDLNKLDKHVYAHLIESIHKSTKIVNGKFIIKTNMTLEELKTLNEGYMTFHSQFILENIINPKEILKQE